MKPQQRNFVVEYKLARRQSTKPDRSIWGNTNFKALAKAAENDAPQLFESRTVSDVVERSLDVRVETPALADIGNAETVPAILAISTFADEHVVGGGHLVQISAEPVRRKAKARSTLVVASIALNADAPLPLIEEQADDLATLEADNRQLKALLANQLVQQNAQLRIMLERFDHA
jgi:hypothetical protein